MFLWYFQKNVAEKVFKIKLFLIINKNVRLILMLNPNCFLENKKNLLNYKFKRFYGFPKIYTKKHETFFKIIV
jgi:hypothetical protein